eukprot:m.6708 g.6708  ORF g.6708 m.6708 type:complete len:1585 (+) comp8596_c0_seq4:99-4853(+)
MPPPPGNGCIAGEQSSILRQMEAAPESCTPFCGPSQQAIFEDMSSFCTRAQQTLVEDEKLATAMFSQPLTNEYLRGVSCSQAFQFNASASVYARISLNVVEDIVNELISSIDAACKGLSMHGPIMSRQAQERLELLQDISHSLVHTSSVVLQAPAPDLAVQSAKCLAPVQANYQVQADVATQIMLCSKPLHPIFRTRWLHSVLSYLETLEPDQAADQATLIASTLQSEQVTAIDYMIEVVVQRPGHGNVDIFSTLFDCWNRAQSELGMSLLSKPEMLLLSQSGFLQALANLMNVFLGSARDGPFTFGLFTTLPSRALLLLRSQTEPYILRKMAPSVELGLRMFCGSQFNAATGGYTVPPLLHDVDVAWAEHPSQWTFQYLDLHSEANPTFQLFDVIEAKYPEDYARMLKIVGDDLGVPSSRAEALSALSRFVELPPKPQLDDMPAERQVLVLRSICQMVVTTVETLRSIQSELAEHHGPARELADLFTMKNAVLTASMDSFAGFARSIQAISHVAASSLLIDQGVLMENAHQLKFLHALLTASSVQAHELEQQLHIDFSIRLPYLEQQNGVWTTSKDKSFDLLSELSRLLLCSLDEHEKDTEIDWPTTSLRRIFQCMNGAVAKFFNLIMPSDPCLFTFEDDSYSSVLGVSTLQFKDSDLSSAQPSLPHRALFPLLGNIFGPFVDEADSSELCVSDSWEKTVRHPVLVCDDIMTIELSACDLTRIEKFRILFEDELERYFDMMIWVKAGSLDDPIAADSGSQEPWGLLDHVTGTGGTHLSTEISQALTQAKAMFDPSCEELAKCLTLTECLLDEIARLYDLGISCCLLQLCDFAVYERDGTIVVEAHALHRLVFSGDELSAVDQRRWKAIRAEMHDEWSPMPVRACPALDNQAIAFLLASMMGGGTPFCKPLLKQGELPRQWRKLTRSHDERLAQTLIEFVSFSTKRLDVACLKPLLRARGWMHTVDPVDSLPFPPLLQWTNGTTHITRAPLSAESTGASFITEVLALCQKDSQVCKVFKKYLEVTGAELGCTSLEELLKRILVVTFASKEYKIVVCKELLAPLCIRLRFTIDVINNIQRVYKGMHEEAACAITQLKLTQYHVSPAARHLSTDANERMQGYVEAAWTVNARVFLSYAQAQGFVSSQSCWADPYCALLENHFTKCRPQLYAGIVVSSETPHAIGSSSSMSALELYIEHLCQKLKEGAHQNLSLEDFKSTLGHDLSMSSTGFQLLLVHSSLEFSTSLLNTIVGQAGCFALGSLTHEALLSKNTWQRISPHAQPLLKKASCSIASIPQSTPIFKKISKFSCPLLGAMLPSIGECKTHVNEAFRWPQLRFGSVTGYQHASVLPKEHGSRPTMVGASGEYALRFDPSPKPDTTALGNARLALSQINGAMAVHSLCSEEASENKLFVSMISCFCDDAGVCGLYENFEAQGYLTIATGMKDWDRTVKRECQVAFLSAMEALVQLGFAHLDLDPSNVCYNPTTKHVKLFDLGTMVQLGLVRYNRCIELRPALHSERFALLGCHTVVTWQNDFQAVDIILRTLQPAEERSGLAEELASLKSTCWNDSLDAALTTYGRLKDYFLE